jgi:hypothetical protein
MYLHDWAASPPAYNDLAYFTAVGVRAVFYNLTGQLIINLYSTWESGGTACSINVTSLADKAVYVRYQHDPSNLSDYCEAWDRFGTRFFSTTTTYAADQSDPNIGVSLGGDDDRRVGFLRVHSTLVAMNSRMPITSDNTAALIHWKFDGDLTDSSGNGYTAVLLSGSPSYAATPFQNPIAVFHTPVVPPFGTWATVRAGSSVPLTGTDSTSQSDAGSSVTCLWQILSGPSMPFLDRASCTPVLTGLVFGQYNFQLTVTDTGGATAVRTLTVGSVSTDANSIVVNSDPSVDTIFGPMMAWGHSPWSYTDERALAATTLRKADYETPDANGYSIADPSFIHNGAGTIDYIAEGLGSSAYPATTAPISATATSIVVDSVSALDLTGLPGVPVRICLGTDVSPCNTYGVMEEIRICSSSGTTLTVCYDGRGQTAYAWAAGTKVGQFRVTGTSTKFLTDSAVPICPGGAPGPAGRVTYSAGQVTITHGSAAVLGVGTTWNTANDVTGSNTRWIRVEATHSVGTPFIFWAHITTLTDTTHVTLARAYPASADDGTFNYKIIEADQRYWGLGYARPDASLTKTLYSASGCESETGAYARNVFFSSGTGAAITGKTYTYQDGLGYRSAFGHNFYGEGLAHRALYYRSGLTDALTAANEVDDNWLRAPEVTTPSGWVLNWGGPVVGSYANVVLNSSAQITWNDLRPYATYSSANFGVGCNYNDSRDQGYLQSTIALSALFETDPSIQSTMYTVLLAALSDDTACKGSDNSWSNSNAYWIGSGPFLTLATGSAIVTGAGLTALNTGCNVTAMGTGTVTNGSAVLTGTGFTSGSMIVVTGTMSGAPYSGFYQYSGTSSPLTLSVLWPGDSGAVTWAITSTDNFSAIAASNADPQLSKNWVCRIDSPTQLTLQRVWDGAGTSSARIYTSNLTGFGQQPFMLGIKTKAMKWSSIVADPTVSAGYASLVPLAADWMYTTGYDPFTQGLHYGRVFGACEPYPTPPASPAFDQRQVGCNYGANAIESGRGLTAEASSSLWAKYEAVTTPTVKTWGDTAYGSIWGNPADTTGGVYSDSNYVKFLLSDAALGSFKWTGFFFGMGMAHQWPGARLGGVTPAVPRTLMLDIDLAAVPSATQFRVTFIEPSGKSVVTVCAASPCALAGDARQGTHLATVEYLSAGSAVLASSSEPLPVIVQ